MIEEVRQVEEDNMKKNIILTLILTILILGGVAVWYFFFNGKDTLVGDAIRDVLPFGNGGGNVTTPADEDKPIEIPVQNHTAEPQKLFRLSETPIAGASSLIKNGVEVVRFADRATGHIYDANPRTLEKIKIANNTQPKIYAALFRKDGNGVIFRTLKNDGDETSNLSIELIPPKSTSTNALYTEVTTQLRGDIDSLDVSDSGKLIYSEKNEKKIILSDFNGNNKQTIFDSQFTDWILSWSGSVVTATTKATSAADGYSYSLSQTGQLTKLLGPENGLTAKRSFDSKNIIYSSSATGPIRSFARNLLNGNGYEILPTTIPEKCSWGRKTLTIIICGTPNNLLDGGEPDLWYQGITHFDDNIWKFDVETGLAEILIEPKKTFGIQLDIINPFLTPDEDYFVFTNKNDLSLWALKLVD